MVKKEKEEEGRLERGDSNCLSRCGERRSQKPGCCDGEGHLSHVLLKVGTLLGVVCGELAMPWMTEKSGS